MNILTVKLPSALNSALAEASAKEHLSKPELVRRAVSAYLERSQSVVQAPSALALAGELVGCFEGGPPDLSSNPSHLDDFGRR